MKSSNLNVTYFIVAIIIVGMLSWVSYFSKHPYFKSAPVEDVARLLISVQELPEAKQVVMDAFARNGSLDLTVYEFKQLNADIDLLKAEESKKTAMLLSHLLKFKDSPLDLRMQRAACSGLIEGYGLRGMSLPNELASVCGSIPHVTED